MKIIGIICEYNPFHNGHIYQINKIKKLYPDSVIIVVLSTCFTQRGETSVLNKYEKTNVALNHNVDLVIELPYIYTVQSADIFSKYSIKILNELKINALVFGSETNNIDYFIDIAKSSLNNPLFDQLIKNNMDKGLSYPNSINNALKDLNKKPITKPNDLLALSYIKEILLNNYNIEPISIKRTSSYHNKKENNSIISANNIRNKLINNINIKKYVPLDVYNILNNNIINNDKYFELLKYKIKSEKDLTKYVDVNEGIDKRIIKYIDKAKDLNDLILLIKTKRYTYNKISRILNHILCSFKKDEFDEELKYIKILGFNNKGQEYLNTIKKDMNIKILNSLNYNYKALIVEKRINEIYSLVYKPFNEDNLIPIKKD